MKKYTSIICTMAVLLMASAVTFVSCSKDEEPAVSGKFTLTVNASKGAQATKDLRLDGTTLTASWKQGEKVYVHNNSTGEDLNGYLEAQSDGVNTVLKGSLTGDIAVGNELSLRFCSSDNYTSQQGTIEWIAENCDLATATVEVTDISTPSVTTTNAAFANQQAIVKFSLRNTGNTDNLSATQLVVNVGGTDYTINPAEETNVFYVALPGFENKEVTLTATVGGAPYISNAVPGITFADGQYYTVAVGMKAPCSYTAPSLVGGTLTYNGSAKTLVTGGSATNGTMYYSTDGGTNWSTSLPTGTNAGNYTVYYKVEPDDGCYGGVASTSLGTKTINKANGWVTLSPSSSSGWRINGSRTSDQASISHHGGSLSYSKGGAESSRIGNLNVSINGNTLYLSRSSNFYSCTDNYVTVTSAATQNYNAASATYYCNQ